MGLRHDKCEMAKMLLECRADVLVQSSNMSVECNDDLDCRNKWAKASSKIEHV